MHLSGLLVGADAHDLLDLQGPASPCLLIALGQTLGVEGGLSTPWGKVAADRGGSGLGRIKVPHPLSFSSNVANNK